MNNEMALSEQSADLIQFTADDLVLFGQASLDFNPLHLDAAYARTTSYGQQVVFGMLGALRCLAQVKPMAGDTVTGMTLEFLAPILVNSFARCVVHSPALGAFAASGRVVVQLLDGSRVLQKATFRIGPGQARPLHVQQPVGDAQAPWSQARDVRRTDLAAGQVRTGRYQVAGGAFAALMARCGLSPACVALSRVAALLWSSYLVGMELPGRRALFNALQIDFDPAGAEADALDFEATVKAFDPRFGLLRVPFVLSSAGQPLAKGEIRAFVRESPALEEDDVRSWVGASDALAGKVAWVVGGSRGLGARIARALALQGATVVVSYLRSAAEALAVAAVPSGTSGRIVVMQADAADPLACAALVAQVEREHGGLDWLICNACPPILPMWVDATTAGRVGAYVAQSVDLVAQPLAAALPLVQARAGGVCVLSSVYAQQAPANFPHYVAAKRAIEGLVESVAAHQTGVGFLLVRPPRLAGELNMPMKGEQVLTAGQVAGVLARHLAVSPPGAGELHCLQEFDSTP